MPARKPHVFDTRDRTPDAYRRVMGGSPAGGGDGMPAPATVGSVRIRAGVEIDPRVRRRYELVDEDDRLWRPGLGDLVRLRTWDIFDRLLPGRGRIADIGGGPGTPAAYLARRGHDVVLLDPLPRHVQAATARCVSQPRAPFRVEQAEARRLPLAGGSIDAALVMGPLDHLVEPDQRLAALSCGPAVASSPRSSPGKGCHPGWW